MFETGTLSLWSTGNHPASHCLGHSGEGLFLARWHFVTVHHHSDAEWNGNSQPRFNGDLKFHAKFSGSVQKIYY